MPLCPNVVTIGIWTARLRNWRDYPLHPVICAAGQVGTQLEHFEVRGEISKIDHTVLKAILESLPHIQRLTLGTSIKDWKDMHCWDTLAVIDLEREFSGILAGSTNLQSLTIYGMAFGIVDVQEQQLANEWHRRTGYASAEDAAREMFRACRSLRMFRGGRNAGWKYHRLEDGEVMVKRVSGEVEMETW